MPNRPIPFTPGSYYHIYNRGAGRNPIFFTSENYLYCIRLLKQKALKYKQIILAYCLMPNHYHLLIYQEGEIAISKFINSVFIAYALAINRQGERSGTLFEGRYKYILINRDSYLFQLCRYIHLNPVAAGLVQKAEDWPYSDYQEWIGLKRMDSSVEQFVHDQFNDGMSYKLFVEDKDELYKNADDQDLWID